MLFKKKTITVQKSITISPGRPYSKQSKRGMVYFVTSGIRSHKNLTLDEINYTEEKSYSI